MPSNSEEAPSIPPEAMRKYLKQLQEVAKYFATIEELFRGIEIKPITLANYPRIGEIVRKQFKDISDTTAFVRDFQRDLSFSIGSYFPPEQEEQVRLVIERPIPDNSEAEQYVERLRRCPTGQKNWSKFQKLCKEIFAYLFCPPLGEPIQESRTKSGAQRRDIIFPIPADCKEFWYDLKTKYDAGALIIECKNWKNQIGPNVLTVSAKYLGRKRLGRFGILVTRKPLSPTAEIEQTRLWKDDDKMMICLQDEHLIQMLKLKESEEKPERILDGIVFTFLEQLD